MDVTLAPSDLHLLVVKCYGPINNLHTEMDTFCGDMTLQKHDTIEQCDVTLERVVRHVTRDTHRLATSHITSRLTRIIPVTHLASEISDYPVIQHHDSM